MGQRAEEKGKSHQGQGGREGSKRVRGVVEEEIINDAEETHPAVIELAGLSEGQLFELYILLGKNYREHGERYVSRAFFGAISMSIVPAEISTQFHSKSSLTDQYFRWKELMEGVECYCADT
jgi:hypothetical protein